MNVDWLDAGTVLMVLLVPAVICLFWRWDREDAQAAKRDAALRREVARHEAQDHRLMDWWRPERDETGAYRD